MTDTTISIGDYVTFRRHEGAHAEHGRCVGRSCHRGEWSYDVETADGKRMNGAQSVALDFDVPLAGAA